MTEPNATPADDDTTPTDDTETSSGAAELAREARNWRKKYQALKAETEALTTRLDAAQRQIVEHHLAGKIADPEDYWRTTSLDDLRDDHGDIDTEAVTTRLGELLAAKPHYAPPNAAVVGATPASVVTGNLPITGDPADNTSWSDLLRR